MLKLLLGYFFFLLDCLPGRSGLGGRKERREGGKEGGSAVTARVISFCRHNSRESVRALPARAIFGDCCLVSVCIIFFGNKFEGSERRYLLLLWL